MPLSAWVSLAIGVGSAVAVGYIIGNADGIIAGALTGLGWVTCAFSERLTEFWRRAFLHAMALYHESKFHDHNPPV